MITALQNKLRLAFKEGIRYQKHKRSDRIYFKKGIMRLFISSVRYY